MSRNKKHSHNKKENVIKNSQQDINEQPKIEETADAAKIEEEAPAEPEVKETEVNQEAEPGKTAEPGKEGDLIEDWQETLAYLEAEEHAGEKKKAEKQKNAEKKAASKKASPKVLLLLGAVIAAMLLGFVYKKYAPSRRQMDIKAYFEWMVNRARGEGETVFEEGELALVLQDSVSASTALYTDDHLYLPYDVVRENIFTRFYWDESNGVMLYTTNDDTWKIPLDSAEYTTKDGTETYETKIFVVHKEIKYISADFLARYVNITFDAQPDNYHALVTYQWGARQSALAKKKSAVRFGDNIKQDIVTKVDKGEQLFVLDRQEKWSRVLTPQGYIGWIQTKRLTETEETQITHEFEEPVYTSLVRDKKINLVWHQIGNEDSNKYFTSDTAGVSGVNVISPTWLSLTDNDGNFSTYASSSYVKKAHKKDMEVWGLVDNFSANMSTAQLVASTESRNRLVDNLITEAQRVGMDGINIDFETLADEAGYGYVQFMRELSVACHANNLVLSVDVPVPMTFNTHFDRKELGIYCDYVIIMGYDEHYSGSEPGSVASLSFEENGIIATLESVPAEKIISGVPFYTRIWYTQNTDEGTNVTSEAYGMNTVATTIDTYNADMVWNDETQQNYAEWTLDDGTYCQIWVEDETSLALKAALVDKYSLGGIAAWALGFERSSIWNVITENIGA